MKVRLRSDCAYDKMSVSGNGVIAGIVTHEWTEVPDNFEVQREMEVEGREDTPIVPEPEPIPTIEPEEIEIEEVPEETPVIPAVEKAPVKKKTRKKKKLSRLLTSMR